MKLKFIFPDGTIKISNDFYVESENQDAILEDFFVEVIQNQKNYFGMLKLKHIMILF